ncbi:MAG: hypothetical protein ACO20X_14885 [Alphaproteobacteria bacterium]
MGTMSKESKKPRPTMGTGIAEKGAQGIEAYRTRQKSMIDSFSETKPKPKPKGK